MAGYFLEGYLIDDYLIDSYFLSEDEVTPVDVVRPTVSEKALADVFPKGDLAWNGMTDGNMRDFSDGLAKQIDRSRILGEKIKSDFYPDTTDLIDEWENVYRLPVGSSLTTNQRRNRLAAVWKRTSPATFDGINEIFALSGFDVNIRPLAPGEDPRDYQDTAIIYADGRPGTVSKNYIGVTGVMRTGQISESSRVGSFRGSRIDNPEIIIPDDEWTWGLMFVIEGSDGNVANISALLESAFEFLIYKNKPLFMWAIARVEYDRWIEYGNKTVISRGSRAFITSLSSTEIALTSFYDPLLVKYSFDGYGWIQEGNEFTIPTDDNYEIISLNSSRVVIYDISDDTLAAYDFDGTDWAHVGNVYSVSGGSPIYCKIAKMSGDSLALVDFGSNTLAKISFDGTDFSQVGNTAPLPTMEQPALTALDSDTVSIYSGSNENTMYRYSFDGADWNKELPSTELENMSHPYSAAMTSTRVAIIDKWLPGLKMYDISGTWKSNGGLHVIPNGTYTNLAPLTKNRVVVYNSSDESMQSYEFTGDSSTGDIPPGLDF